MYSLIQNSDLEGDLKIESIKPLRILGSRRFIGKLISLLTLFLFSLICRWFIKVKLWFYFKEENELLYATHLLLTNIHGEKEIHKLTRVSNQNKIIFKYRHLEYNLIDQKFQPQDTGYVGKNIDVSSIQPQNQENVQLLNKWFGNCEVHVPIPGILSFFEKELTSPLYFTQYTSITIFMLEGYFQLAILQPIIALSTSLINYIILRRAMQKLKEKAQNNQQITVLRRNQEHKLENQIIDSIELVPGDIFFASCNQILPCDCLLLSGEVLVDEQSLTGESIPIQKEHIQQDVLENFNYIGYKKSILFDGTKILDVKHSVKVLVLRTGYLSYKGQIFRNALYPKPPKIIFFIDAVKFLVILSVLVISLYFALLWKMIILDYDASLIALRLGDAIVWIIPPNLVTLVNLSMTATLTRLRFREILGTQPDKTLEASQTDVICFDKTGTLTTNQVNVKNVYDAQNRLIQNISSNKFMQQLMSSCHSCYLLNNQLIGDPLEISMIQQSQLSIENDDNCKFRVNLQESSSDNYLQVIKIFEFTSELQRMGVIAKNSQDNNYYYFSKGSPERISQLCMFMPQGHKQFIEQESIKGMRIICTGYKQITKEDIKQNQIHLEQNLNYLGSIVFENKLKADTSISIIDLKFAELKLKIISGDHILNCINCGQESGIIDKEKIQSIFFIDYEQHLTVYELKNLELQKFEIKDDEEAINQISILLPSSKYQNSIQKLDKIDNSIYSWAITGSAFEILKKEPIFLELFQECQVFARMNPLQKSEVIKLLQQQNHHVCMVGDGTNDCHALKQANIGISFQQCDAAMTASFVNIKDSISCIKDVLLQGKATSCNVLEMFKYYMIINVSKYVSAQLMMYQMQNFNYAELLYLNYFNNIPIIAFQTLTPPSNILTKDKLNTSMISKVNFLPIMVMLILSGLNMFGSYLLLYFQPWYIPYINNSDETRYFFYGDMNTQQFINMNIYFLLSFYAINTYKPFKIKFLHQYHFNILIFILLIMGILLQFVIMDSLDDWLLLTDIFEYYNIYYCYIDRKINMDIIIYTLIMIINKNQSNLNNINFVDIINPIKVPHPSRRVQLLEHSKAIKLLNSYRRVPQIVTEFQSPIIVNSIKIRKDSNYSLQQSQQQNERDKQSIKLDLEGNLNKFKQISIQNSLPQIPLTTINSQTKLNEYTRNNTSVQSPKNSETKRSIIRPQFKTNNNNTNNQTSNSTTTGSSKDVSQNIIHQQPNIYAKNIIYSYCGKPRKRKLSVSAKSFIVFDCCENKIVTQRKCTKRMEIASLTKIMTFYVTLVILEELKLNLKEIRIKVTKKASETIGTTAELKYNDILNIEDLLYGLMLPSGNDAAVLIAQAIGTIILFYQQNKRLDSKLLDIEQLSAEGFYYNIELKAHQCPIEIFISKMNYYSIILKQQNTQFACVHGLANEENYSSCNDIVLLSQECLKRDVFQQVISCKEYIAKSNTKCYEWKNTNKLLDKGFFGIKTGITDSAGPCLASAYKSNEMEFYIIVVLNCKNLQLRFDETIALLQHAKYKKSLNSIVQ